MGSIDLTGICLDSIRQISDEVADAVVYLDSGCSEAFQFIGAFPLLLDLGARSVCSLENMSSLDTANSWNHASTDTAKKMVFITSRLLSDAHRYILRCLSTHRNVLSCSIFTSTSEVAHSAYVDSPLGPDAYHEYESLLLQDYEEFLKRRKVEQPSFNQLNESRIKDCNPEQSVSEFEGWSQSASTEANSGSISVRRDIDDSSPSMHSDADEWPRLVVSVHHFPMVLCPLSPRVFVLPSECTIGEACLSNNFEDALSPGLPAICTGQPPDGDDIPPGTTLTAHFLYHLASKMDVKMEIFSLGDLSRSVGKILTDMSSLYDVGRRNKKSAGLLLIDRSLDLLTPCCHGDSIVDRIFSYLPRRKREEFSLHARLSQVASKHGPAQVKRAPLDVMIPLGRVLKEGQPAAVSSSSFLAECVTAFSSGWSSGTGGSQSVDSTSHVYNLPDNSLVDPEISILSGSLISNANYLGANYFEALFDRKTKDGALLIRKWLMDIIRRDKIPLSKTHLSPAISGLHSMIKLLSSQEKSLIRNRDIIQLAVAADIALSEPHSSHWDAFASAEKILAINAGDTSQSLSSQIRDLINTSSFNRLDDLCANKRSHGLLSFQDALLLTVTGYILAGENFPTSGYQSPFSWEEEHSLKEAVVDAILEMSTVPEFRFLHGLEEELEASSRKAKLGKSEEPSKDTSSVEDFDDQWGSWDDEDSDRNDEQAYGNMQLKLELRDRVENLFKSFHKLAGLKWKNPVFREGPFASQSYNFDFDSYHKKGLISRILAMVLAKYEIPGLEYHSSAVGRFFKSGFGRFGLGQAKPSLGDQDILLVFVVGGINGLEVYEAQEAVSESGRPVELILGGTTLLTPNDMFDLLLGSSSYF